MTNDDATSKDLMIIYVVFLCVCDSFARVTGSMLERGPVQVYIDFHSQPTATTAKDLGLVMRIS